jgi:transcriptional regulator with XRE-family HTH domain
MKTFSHEKIRELREAQDMTLQELAIRIGANHRQQVSLWECGKFKPGTVYLPRLAEALGVDIGYFFE